MTAPKLSIWLNDAGLECVCGDAYNPLGEDDEGYQDATPDDPFVTTLTCVSCGRSYHLRISLTPIEQEEPS